LPSVALVTEKFWPQGEYVAKVAGMPDLPRVQLPHPVAGSSPEQMDAIAARVAEPIVIALRGAT